VSVKQIIRELSLHRKLTSLGCGWAIAATIALLSPTASVRASEGYISLYYTVEGFGQSSYWLYHSPNASEGLDDQDRTWQFTTCASCMTDTRAVSSVESQNLKLDYRPLTSETEVSVHCSVVSRNGDPVVINDAPQWVGLYINGFEGYGVTVNGFDARKTSRINLAPVTGTFSSGSTLTTLNIRFSRQAGQIPETPGEEGDDGQGEEPVSNDAGNDEAVLDTLLITNSIEGCPSARTGVWALMHRSGDLDALDDDDVLHAKPSNAGFHSFIVSAVADPATGRQRLLAVDARPPKSKEAIELSLGVESRSNESVSFVAPVVNELVFSFPVETANHFAGKPITFQLYAPADPAARYPVWDVRKIIQNDRGVLPLGSLRGSFASGVAYLSARVSTSRLPGDVLWDGKIDLHDYDRIASQQGTAGPSDADIASSRGLGLPDGAVDVWDLYYLYGLLADVDRAKVTPPVLPVLTEGFESGDLNALHWNSLQWPHWVATSEDRHSGTYSVRPGKVSHGGITTLSLALACTDGHLSFWRRVSSEAYRDYYRFYIDNKLREELSGDVAWSEVSFPVEAGTHTFRWEYEKDNAGSFGQDTVYLDDLIFPARL
jgi:hypothetical protein